MIFLKLFKDPKNEIIDLDIFDSGVKSVLDFEDDFEDDLMPRFIYCGIHYFSREQREKLKEMILTKMGNYGIQSSILTMLHMWRLNLVTK